MLEAYIWPYICNSSIYFVLWQSLCTAALLTWVKNCWTALVNHMMDGVTILGITAGELMLIGK